MDECQITAAFYQQGFNDAKAVRDQSRRHSSIETCLST
jgi:hypothetical protein